MMMAAINPYESGVLKEGVHDRLVADLANFAKDAAILPKWIMTPLAEAAPTKVVSWVKEFHQHETSGLCLTGDPAKADDVCAAIAGALVRNFIRAQVYTLNQAIEAVQAGTMDDPSCLILPNLFMGKALGSTLVDWRLQLIYDVIYSRHIAGRKTVVYVSDVQAMATEYGLAFAQTIKNNFDIVKL